MSKIPSIAKTYILNAESIDAISEEMSSYAAFFLKERKDIARYRLTLEECLLSWMDAGLEGREIRVVARRRIIRHCFCVCVGADAPDPFTNDAGAQSGFTSTLMSSLGLAPEYSKGKDGTELSFPFRRNGNPATQLVAVIAASIIVGMLGLAFVPAEQLASVRECALEPLYDKFFELLRCIAGPMVFLSVAWGVYGIGDSATLGRIGKKLLLGYFLVMALAVLPGFAAFPFLGNGLANASEFGDSQFSSIYDIILSIIPSDFFSPFINGNTLQIIFLASLMGFALLIVGKKAREVAVLIEQINSLIVLCMEFITKLVPFFVFLIILNLCWSGNLADLLSAWKLLVAMVALFIIIVAIFLVVASVNMKEPVGKVAQYGLNSFLIAFTTASSAAAFNETIRNCTKNFHIAERLTSFAVPLGIVMHNPFAALINFIMIIFFAAMFGVSVSVPWLVTAYLIAIVVAVATPPVPGGAAAAYAIMFTQMGIPTEALAIVLPLDIIIDFIVTGCEMYCLPITIRCIAKKINLVDDCVKGDGSF